MDNFKTIYRILSALEKSMDVEDPDWGCISPEQLKISETRWASLMRAIVEAGYIAGVKVVSSKTGTPQVYLIEPRITLEGLEYLEIMIAGQSGPEIIKCAVKPRPLGLGI